METVPEPIRQYLEGYPMFAVSEDISHSFVRTSVESFHYAVKLIYQSLSQNQIVWATDNLSLSPNFAKYWVEEGLQYLRVNHEAASRGVQINRIFIVSESEYVHFKPELTQLGMLHAKTGVNPYVAIYERLPLQCRYDFAIWGDTYVDEVVYDIKSNNIIDNYIHWSTTKINQFGQKMNLIRNLIEADWTVTAQRENTFEDILKYAAGIRQHIESLPHRKKTRFSGEKSQAQHKTTIRILLLSANPSDSTRLRLDEEFREIDQALRQSEFRNRFVLEKHLGPVKKQSIQF